MPDTNTAEQRRGQVVKSYSAQYTDPLIVRAGESLIESARVEPWEDIPEWMWVWCSDARGKSGWVPRDYIAHDTAGAHARFDYSTAELTVAAGELIAIERSTSGWHWCHTDDGRAGWVPASHITLLAG